MENYRRCFNKAINQTKTLLVREDCGFDHDEIHAVKSILYAAIERAGIGAERLAEAQRKLRELLFLVTLRSDPSDLERREAWRILEELKKDFTPV